MGRSCKVCSITIPKARNLLSRHFVRCLGDYRIGETLLAESALVITFSGSHTPSSPKPEGKPADDTLAAPSTPAPLPASPKPEHRTLAIPSLSKIFPRSRTPSPEPELTQLPTPPTPRRLVLLLVGLAPHRKLWTTSQRPNESVLHYKLANGCPAIVLPARVGAPLLAWVGLTLEQLWKLRLPEVDTTSSAIAPAPIKLEEGELERSFEGVVGILYEYIELCIDWERVEVPGNENAAAEEEKRRAVRDAVVLFVAAAVRSKDSKQVQKEMDKERSGLAMWRIP